MMYASASASAGALKLDKQEPFHIKLEDMGGSMSGHAATGAPSAQGMHGSSDVALMGGASLRGAEGGAGSSVYNSVLDYSSPASHQQQHSNMSMSLASGYSDVSAYADYQHASSSATASSSDGFDANGECSSFYSVNATSFSATFVERLRYMLSFQVMLTLCSFIYNCMYLVLASM